MKQEQNFIASKIFLSVFGVPLFKALAKFVANLAICALTNLSKMNLN
jgi:hypothetical protein